MTEDGTLNFAGAPETRETTESPEAMASRVTVPVTGMLLSTNSDGMAKENPAIGSAVTRISSMAMPSEVIAVLSYWLKRILKAGV